MRDGVLEVEDWIVKNLSRLIPHRERNLSENHTLIGKSVSLVLNRFECEKLSFVEE